MNTTNKLLSKLEITGTIVVKTGLAIGGNKSGIDIGGLDNPVIKTHKGVPYIPGSSLKGKIRSLLAKVAGTEDVKADVKLMKENKSDYKHIARIFGFGANEADKILKEEGDKGQNVKGEALLKFRDAFLTEHEKKDKYTEEKMENTIHRVKGTANPRPLERVLPETEFEMNLCLDVYDDEEANKHLELIRLGIQLLEKDYLGGGGSRGNGRVEITNLKVTPYIIQNKEIEAKDPEYLDGYKFKLSNHES